MSPNVGNFVQDLVHMAQATERLPLVEAELERANTAVEAYATQVQRLEMKLIDRANEIDTLHAKVREAEQGRDAAETMFLECDDKLSAFRRLAQSFSSDLTSLVKAQEPVPPVAIPVEEPLPGVSVDPLPTSPEQSNVSVSADDGTTTPQGQSEMDPTVAQASPITGPAESIVSSEPSLPYHGKLYSNTNNWVSRTDWLIGGGNDSTYDWREGMRLPDGFYYTDHGIEYKS